MKTSQQKKAKVGTGKEPPPALKKSKTIMKHSVNQWEAIRKEVRTILGLSETEHGLMILEHGIYWLNGKPGRTNTLQNPYSKDFWEWYTKQHDIRDKNFVQKCLNKGLYQCERKELVKLYEREHSDLEVVFEDPYLQTIYPEILAYARLKEREGM